MGTHAAAHPAPVLPVPHTRLPRRLLLTTPVVVTALALVLAIAPAAGAATTSWTFAAMDVPPERPLGGGVRVAIVDSGIDMSHPAFAGRIAGATDCTGSGGDPSACRDRATDDNGHGTHIAGIVAARATAEGPEGVAPDAQVLAVRVLTNTCEGRGEERRCRALGELDDVVAGVRWAIERKADVINLSIDASVGLDWEGGPLAGAIRDAWRAGIVVVASTGNRSVAIEDPALASLPLLLVGALDADGRQAAYSNLPGTARWGLMAPGGEAGGACPDAGVLSTYPRALEAAGTGCLAGTSMAAAYVSGALASLISTGMPPREALAHLVATAQPADGALRADLGAALEALAKGEPTSGPTSPDLDAATTTAGDGRPWYAMHPVTMQLITAIGLALAAAAVLNRRRGDPLPGF